MHCSKHFAQWAAAPSLSAVRLLANVHTQRQSQIHNKVAQVSVEQGVVGCCAEVQQSGGGAKQSVVPHNEREEGATGWLDPLPISSPANTFYTLHHHTTPPIAANTGSHQWLGQHHQLLKTPAVPATPPADNIVFAKIA